MNSQNDAKNYTNIANRLERRKRYTRRESDIDNRRLTSAAFYTAVHCIIAVSLFVAVGMMYMFFYDRSLSAFEALYLCVITFTTIGYGDIHPNKNATKVFMSFYIFFGLLVLTVAARGIYAYWKSEHRRIKEIVVKKMIDFEESEASLFSIKKAKTNESIDNDGSDHPVNSFECDDSSTPPATGTFLEIFFKEHLGLPSYAVPIMKELLFAGILIVLDLAVGVIWFSAITKDFNFVDSLYLSAMTISTVGYGDVYPTTFQSRLFVIFYAVLGTLVTARALGSFNKAIDKYQEAHRNDIIVKTELKIEDLVDMDVNGDRSISKEEYLLYKLFQMRLVDPSVVASLEKQFNILDADGNGELTINDVSNFQDVVRHKRKYSTVGHWRRRNGIRSVKSSRILSQPMSVCPTTESGFEIRTGLTQLGSESVRSRSMSIPSVENV